MTYIHDDNTTKEKPDYRTTIKKQAVLLAELLIKSPEYVQFIQAREKLEADNEQSTILNELRQKQMSLGFAAMMGEEQTEETEDFEKLYLSLANNPVISEYLFAEGRLFHLISDVEEVFSKKLEIWHMPEVVENYEPDSLLN